MKVDLRRIIASLFMLFLLGTFQQASAQFTVTEDFRGSGSPDVIIGDDAYLTSGVDDPVGAGWLRLTEDEGDQRGYAYINKSFPSTLGVLIDFEYTMWRSHEATYNGADGISIFLFDADYGPEADGTQFELGAYGGSLGYANSTASSPTSPYGLMGGYLGVGLDAYGNFVRESEGKNGGSTNVSPNSIAMRGPQTNDENTTTRYLEGVTILDDGSIVDALNEQGNAAHDIVDYNTLTTARPSNATFYRRFQIEIVPTNDGKYEITVRWKTSLTSPFIELMSYITTDVPPAQLKIGFAGSTGGGYNNHEIRNLLITTPGNLRITKKADKDILRSVPNGSSENEVTYTMYVVNDTDADLHNIEFEDQLTDANDDQIAASMFTITNISHSGFLPGTSLPTTSSSNQFTGTLNLAANTTATITVKGTLNAVPFGNVLKNTAKVTPTDIMDQDLGNNISTVSIPVISEQSDLVISQTVDQSCLNTTSGNTFTINVANMGSLDLGYSTGSPVEVIGTLPSGATISNTNNSGWSYNLTGSTFTFTTTGSGNLSTGNYLPSISYTLVGNSSYTNSVSVNSDSEEPSNDGANNQSDYAIESQPSAPTLPSGVTSPITYYVGENAQPLSAEAAAGNILKWYINPGGIASNIAYTPNTTTAGITSYWVSQTNGNCESALTEIQVQVLAVPTITGTVYHDINGLLDNKIDNGSGINGISNLWIVAVDQNTNQVAEATAVSQFNGTYTLGLTTNAIYNLILINASIPPANGDTAPTASLPVNWTNTGEYLGAGAGNDGTVDGILEVNFNGTDVTNANFGITYIEPVRTNPLLLNPVKGN